MRLAMHGVLVTAAGILIIVGLMVRGAACDWCDVIGGTIIALGCIAAVGLVWREHRPRQRPRT
jgi:uncharacterized membrane protein